MLTTDFCVVSDGDTVMEEASPLRAASQLSLDSRDQGRIQNVLATTLNQATTSGFSCYVLSEQFKGEALLKIKPSLSAFSLNATLPEIPIPCITSIIVESALIKKIKRLEFPATDLSLIDGAMGVTFDRSVGLPNALVIFNTPDERRRSVALISLLRISPPHRRMAEAVRGAGDSEIYDNILHTSPPQSSSPKQLPKPLRLPQAESFGQSPLVVRSHRPSRIDGAARSTRPTRTNMARSPLRAEDAITRKPASNTPPATGYFLDHQWRQYRSLSPEQRATLRTGRTPHPEIAKPQRADPLSARSRVQTPPPIGSRLCEMCMTPPPSLRYEQFDISSDDIRPRFMTPPPTRSWPAQPTTTTAALKIRPPPSSSTQTTRVPETPQYPSVTGDESHRSRRSGKRRPSLLPRRFPIGPHPSELKSEVSPKSQATMPIRFYSPMRAKQVYAPSPAPQETPKPRQRVAPPAPVVYSLLGGDANACVRAINVSAGSDLLVDEPLADAHVSGASDSRISGAPVRTGTADNSRVTEMTRALTPKQGDGSMAPKKLLEPLVPPPEQFAGAAGESPNDNGLLKPAGVASPQLGPPTTKMRSFTEYFDKDFSETDQVEILTTENTSTVIHAKQLSRHPYEAPRVSAIPFSSPTIEEDAEAEKEPSAPSATDESFDISASLITPSYIKRKTRRQLHKQAASPLAEITSSPLSAHDESWRPHDSLSPLDKLQLSRIGVPTPFTVARIRQSEGSTATGANAFKQKAPAMNATLDWR